MIFEICLVHKVFYNLSLNLFLKLNCRLIKNYFTSAGTLSIIILKPKGICMQNAQTVRQNVRRELNLKINISPMNNLVRNKVKTPFFF